MTTSYFRNNIILTQSVFLNMYIWIMVLLPRWPETINSRRFSPDLRVLCPQLMRQNWSLTCCGRLTRYAVNDQDD